MIIIIIDKKKKKKKKGNPQNETQSLTKRLNMDIWVTGTLSQLFVRVCHNEIKFSKSKVVSGKTPIFVIGSLCNSPFCLS